MKPTSAPYLFILIMMFALSACSSIPITTMLKMRSMDETTFLQTQPEDVRTRITLLPNIRPDLAKTRLNMGVDLPEGQRQFSFSLEQESVEGIVRKGGFFSEDRQMMAYTLRLSKQANKDFVDLQQIAKAGQWQGLDIDINVRFEGHEAHDSGVMTVELKLAAEQGFFTLIDEYEYTVGEQRSF